MAVTVGTKSTQLWQGLSTDAKPVHNSAPAPRTNDVFFEKDTGKWLLFDGDKWTATAAGTGSVVPPMA